MDIKNLTNDELIQLYIECNYSLQAIETKYNLSNNSAGRLFKQRNIDCNLIKQERDCKLKEELEYYILEQHLSYTEIGKIYGCSGTNIKKKVQKFGIVPIKETTKTTSNENICPSCGGYKYKTSKLCQKCSNKEKYEVRDRELGYYIGYGEDKKQYLSTKLNDVRKDARRFMETESGQEKVCKYCHNHEFDDILEVHHLRGITTFNEHDKISKINNDENLVWLCPNHHRMLELGLIEL